jgi:hypothetical protein
MPHKRKSHTLRVKNVTHEVHTLFGPVFIVNVFVTDQNILIMPQHIFQSVNLTGRYMTLNKAAPSIKNINPKMVLICGPF